MKQNQISTKKEAGILISKLNPLRQRQILRPVDRVRLSAHINFPCVRAGFAPAAGFFFAAECAADLRARRANIDVRNPAIRAANR